MLFSVTKYVVSPPSKLTQGCPWPTMPAALAQASPSVAPAADGSEGAVRRPMLGEGLDQPGVSPGLDYDDLGA